MNVEVTFTIPESAVSSAQAVATALGGYHAGMFQQTVAEGAVIGSGTPIMRFSTGLLREESPLLAGQSATEQAITDAGNTIPPDIGTFFSQVDINIPGQGKVRLAELEALRVEAEAAGLPWWRIWSLEFSEEFG